MKVVGFKDSAFNTESGDRITGVNIYCTYPLDKGVGDGVERVYMTDKKLNACGYTPALGDDIRVLYNKYGKPDVIEYA